MYLPLSFPCGASDAGSAAVLPQCRRACFLAAMQFHRKWKQRQKGTIKLSCLLPAGPGLLPAGHFPVALSIPKWLKQGRSITSLERLFSGLAALTVQMALIFLSSVFLCFLLFCLCQFLSVGYAPPTPLILRG